MLLSRSTMRCNSQCRMNSVLRAGFLLSVGLGLVFPSAVAEARAISPGPPSLSFAQAANSGTQLELPDGLSATIPPGWRVTNRTQNSVSIAVPLQKERKLPVAPDRKDPKPESVVASEAGMLILVEHGSTHAQALARLSALLSEHPEKATAIIIAGWPGIERRYRSLMPEPGDDEQSANVQTNFVTTAVAVGSLVVRFETMLAPDANPEFADQAVAIARSLRGQAGPADTSRREIDAILSAGPTAHNPPSEPNKGSETKPGHGDPGIAIQVQPGVGELEVASNDGKHVVIAANSGWSYSDTSGSVYTRGGGTPCNQASCDGDPTLAVGTSGQIYYGWIGGPNCGPNCLQLGDGLSFAALNAHSFTFQAMMTNCPGSTGCTVADQPHIAADRNNASSSGGDLIYHVWRDFGTTFTIRINCSSNSGSTWTAGNAIGSGDLPRVSVGGDGSVYAAWPSGSNMELQKFTNCDSGLTPVGLPVTVAAFTNVVCPVPGLDRCNGRNILSSPVIAVDDLSPNHIYYAFATSTGTGNENVVVYDSIDGGVTFPRSVRVNTGVTARRFMPWIASYGGVAAIAWYDRRNATASTNDLTRYFVGGAAVRGPNLVALAENDLSGASDNECSTWPVATNAQTDSESCSTQPQLAGRCLTSTGTGSGTPCDFSSTHCPVAGESCLNGRGQPKYGDYNGNAVGAGRSFSAWSSSVPPASVGGASGNINVYASADRIPSDFYVRDWNQSLTVFDNGAQPSTQAVFWSSSDVWNQAATTVEPVSSNGSIVGDSPTRAGTNFAFARVSRTAPAMTGAPNATVTVNFLMGDYGLGAPFISIGSQTVSFAAGDITQITPGLSWSIPATSSSHLCLAVQISGPDGDTFAPPSLVGRTPGPADPLILIDNNKAQRNLEVSSGTESGTEVIGMIRNGEQKRRAMVLGVKVPEDVKVEGTFDIIGGEKVAGVPTIPISNGTRIPLGVLAPGEIRWLRFHATSLAGISKPTPIDIFEDNNRPSNGFTILLERQSVEVVAHQDLIQFASVLLRLAELEKSAAAAEQSKFAMAASRAGTEAEYLAYLFRNRAAITAIIAVHLKRSDPADAFGINAALSQLWSALTANNANEATAANAAVTERLDADLSFKK
jgi:hypothetical protein